MKRGIWLLGVVFWLMWVGFAYGMTPAEEKRLFELLGEIKGELSQVNRRIDDLNRRIDDLRAEMNARFEQVEKRFEQVDKRFEQVDKRFEQVDKRFEQIDKRFEQVDRRFDQVDRRFEEQLAFMKMLAGIFSGLVVAVIGIVIWDRRTAVRAAVKEARRDLEKEYELGLIQRIVEVLREKARGDEELASIMRRLGLL